MGSGQELYIGAIYRPPSEARSLIVQVTTGCSYNRCIYCSMYQEADYQVRPEEEVLQNLYYFRQIYPQVRRIFISDGDAFGMGYERLLALLIQLRTLFPECERISAYASVSNVLSMSSGQLSTIREAGLSLVYLGVESGSDEVLKLVKKPQSAKSTVSACTMLKVAGITLSVTVICGLGGRALSEEHATKTSEILNRIDPEYLGILRLTIDEGTLMQQMVREQTFLPLTEAEVIGEMHTIIEGLELSSCVVRSNHACNYVYLGGTLFPGSADKQHMLSLLEQAAGRV